VSTRITTGMIQRGVLSDLNRANTRLARTQEKVASGKEITRPSDDPFKTSRALALRTSREGTRQYQRTISDARGWQETAEQALDTMTKDVQRVQALVIQAGSDTMDQESRNGILAEIQQITEGLKQEGNASYRGRYVFGGTATDAPPYQAGATDAYGGDTKLIARQVGPGVALPINITGDSILGNGQAALDSNGNPIGNDNMLLHVMRDIADDLKNGRTDLLRGTDLDRLNKNLDTLLTRRAENGAMSNRLEAADSRLQQIEETETTLLSETEDADIAKTMIDFSSQSAAYQAALKSGANIIQPSLMDFLR
jgi:flagellar hook-associated protein 3 FlgL